MLMGKVESERIKEAHRAQIQSVRGKGQELTGHTGHKFEWPEDPDGPERPEVHAVLLSLGGILLLLMGEEGDVPGQTDSASYPPS